MIHTDKILFIPSLRKGNGTGHLKRCLDWGKSFEQIHICVLNNRDDELLEYRDLPVCLSRQNIVWHDNPGGEWDLIILDNRSTDSIPEVLTGIPLMAIDESGNLRHEASYVMDTLPSLHHMLMNTDGFRFLNRPFCSNRPDSVKNILISFGGEDLRHLTGRVLASLKNQRIQTYLQESGMQIDLIDPAGQNSSIPVPHVKLLPYIEGLSEKITDYDLIIGHYGMTAFEALSSRRFIFLLNPGTYHDNLSKSAGLPYAADADVLSDSQLEDVLIETLKQHNRSIEKIVNRHKKLWKKFSKENEDIKEWLCSMSISSDFCPVCGSTQRIELARYENKSYFQCTKCKMQYMVQFRIKSDIYNENYFFSEYKEQYGKTYLEDFPHIRKMAAKRLKSIKRLNPEADNLLDIGCAYGPFLKSASELGYRTTGLDISQDAVNYIAKHFSSIRSFQGDLNTESVRSLFHEQEFSVITLWYVIEHFSNLKEILPYISSRLQTNGVLALATPYASGVSGRFRKDKFYENSPEDHYTIWDRTSARRSLRNAGFKKIKFVSTGHHPERFPIAVQKVVPKLLLLIFSRVLGWGDTFEIYAKKG